MQYNNRTDLMDDMVHFYILGENKRGNDVYSIIENLLKTNFETLDDMDLCDAAETLGVANAVMIKEKH